MEYINISDVKKSYDRVLFQDVNLSINSGDRTSIVGQNGRGKTTLIKIILGIEPYDDGTVRKKGDLSVSYSPQIWGRKPDMTPRNILREEDPRLAAINKKLADPKTYEDPEVQDAVISEYESIVATIREPDENKYYKLLEELDFQHSDYDIPISSLSSGQRSKVSVARTLSQKADMYILDEPTNHLDLQSREWLEEYLKRLDTVLMVSHDKQFINTVSNRIWELDEGRFRVFTGNYESYLEEKSKEFGKRVELYRRQKEEIARLRESARIKGMWVMRGATKLGSTVKHLKRRADKLEKGGIDRPIDPVDKMKVDFGDHGRTPNYILELRNVSKRYGHRDIMLDLNQSIYSGDKIALLGPNGQGKSTLLKMIIGQEPYEGEISVGRNVRISYYDQELEILDEGRTVLGEIKASDPNIKEGEARKLLAKMLFKGDDVFKRVGTLSLGERSRVMLSKFMAEKSNLLILDEPVNNLDIVSAELLQEGLVNYNGNVLVVSHDRSFINGLCNRIWYLEDSELMSFNGNYNLFKEHFSEREN